MKDKLLELIVWSHWFNISKYRPLIRRDKKISKFITSFLNLDINHSAIDNYYPICTKSTTIANKYIRYSISFFKQSTSSITKSIPYTLPNSTGISNSKIRMIKIIRNKNLSALILRVETVSTTGT